MLHKTNIHDTKPMYLKKEQKSILIFDENNRIYNYILNFLIFIKYTVVKNIVLVIKIAVNMEQIIPMLSVVAKPLIGPEPIKDNTNAVNKVVKLASKIVIKALSYPEFIDAKIDFPILFSSLIRSKIITLASTVIPIVNNNPAIPGSVKTASIVINTDKTNNKFKINAILEINPENL